MTVAAMTGVEPEIETEPVLVLSAPLADRGTRRCACGVVAMGDQVRHGDDACVPFTMAREAERVAFPAPEVDSRRAWDGSGCPGAVAKLAERAVAASWDVRVQRSRGSAPHAATGAPGAVKWRYAVVLSGGDGGAAAYAVYDGTTWRSVTVWDAARPWFLHASVTDLAEWIDARGAVGDGWFAGILARIEAGRMREAERKLCDKGEHPKPMVWTENLGPMFGYGCDRCGNTWARGKAAWRKMSGSKKEGMS